MDPKKLTVAEVMSANVLALPEKATVREALAALDQRGISGAPVVDESGACTGVFSLADGARSASGASKFFAADPLEEPAEAEPGTNGHELVSAVMSRELLNVGPQTSIEAAAKLMVRRGVHRLLVLEEGGLVGIVTSLDIVRIVAGYARAEEPQSA